MPAAGRETAKNKLVSTTQGVNVLRPQVSWPALSGSFYVLHIQLKRLPSILTTQTVHVMVCFVFVFVVALKFLQLPHARMNQI